MKENLSNRNHHIARMKFLKKFHHAKPSKQQEEKKIKPRLETTLKQEYHNLQHMYQQILELEKHLQELQISRGWQHGISMSNRDTTICYGLDMGIAVLENQRNQLIEEAGTKAETLTRLQHMVKQGQRLAIAKKWFQPGKPTAV